MGQSLQARHFEKKTDLSKWPHKMSKMPNKMSNKPQRLSNKTHYLSLNSKYALYMGQELTKKLQTCDFQEATQNVQKQHKMSQ